MDELTFVSYGRPTRACVKREQETVVLRIGRKRLTFPVRAVPALIKMLAETALVDDDRGTAVRRPRSKRSVLRMAS
jgi:hypothetical protein